MDREQELDAQIQAECVKACCSHTALLMTESLDRALHGESWARDASPREVWLRLLDEVRFGEPATPRGAAR